MANKKKLNSLQQEILLQEQIAVANEINKLEYEVSNGIVNIARNNRFRFWVAFFTILIFLIFAIYILIIILLPEVLNLSLHIQKVIIFGSSLIMVLVPLFSILYLVCSSLRIKKKNAEQKRVNQIMLTRLLNYYKMLKFEFDPERYKIYDDSFVVDVDENGNLIKYVRFYNDDGSITTKPFKNLEELRKYIDETEEQKRLKIENEALMKKAQKLESINQEFNNFDMLDHNIISKTIVDPSNIGTVKLVKENVDFYPDQYEDKVFKWYSKDDYRDASEFRDSLRGNLLENSWDNGTNVITDANWLKGDLSNARKKKNFDIFFKNYDLQKELAQTADVVSFVNLIRNFDLNKNPDIDWEQTIDPKDIEKEKLHKYNELIKEYEDRALALTNEQIRLETLLKNDKSNVLKVQLVDDVGIDTYEKFDPYKNIRKELDKQQRRVDEIQRAKALFKEFGIEETNFDGLTIKEIKKIVDMKVKEAKKLKELSQAENVDQLVALNNEIARIKNEKFKEVHLPNEKYENDDGQWEYHDGAGNYFVLNDNNEWVPTQHAAITFEQNKENRIARAQQKYYDQQLKKTEQDKLEMERKVREVEQLNAIKAEREYNKQKMKEERIEAKRLAKEAKQKEKDLIKESKLQEKESSLEYEKQFDHGKTEYREIHPANEPFIGPEGKYVYHDGNGNYFSTNENNEWVPIPPLYVKENPFEVIEEKEKKKIQKQQMKELKKRQEELEKEIANNKKHSQEATPETTQTTSSDQNQQAYTQNNGVIVDEQGGQQWTDENGTTWYLDAAGNYYWWDGTNWVPYQA